MNQELYTKAWRRRHDINERAFYAYLHTKIGAETKRYISSLDGRKAGTFHITNYFNERWFLEIIKDSYLKFGFKQKDLLERYNKKAEDDGFNEAWLLAVLLLFKDITRFIMILGIINTIKSDIKRFVEEKLSEGIPVAAIITLLSLYLSQRNITRSQTIARTELTMIMNQASMVWAELQPVPLKKKWLVINDGKERPSHGAMESYPSIALNEKFIVGGSLMNAPGDSSAPANELVNCRCGLMFI